MRGIRCLLAAVLAAGIVTVVAAQPGRQPNFGGAQDTVLLVLTNTALQEEVKVTDAQKEKFKGISEKQKDLSKKANEGLKDKFADAKGDKDKMKDLFAEMQKENGKVTTEIKKLVDAELTTEQKTRLKQISVQALGTNAFADPDAKQGGGGGFGFGGGGFSDSQKAIIKDVASTLKLTDDQKTKIKAALEEYTKDRDSLRKDIFGEKGGKGAFDAEKQKDFATKSGKLSTEVMGKIADVLTADQKTAWKGLVGETFDVAKLRPTFTPKKD